MTEPARNLPYPEELEADADESPELPVLQRWVETRNGEMELVEMPLTPELFVNPELEDKILQGKIHGIACHDLFDVLSRHFKPRRDVQVLFDMKHDLGVPGLPAPGPDISIVLGTREDIFDLSSFDVKKEGVRPSLIIEVISPDKKSIRDVDRTRKVRVYRRAGIPEYILVDPPRHLKPGYVLWGYRMDSGSRYRRMKQDAEGRLLSETTQLLFGVSPDGDRLLVFDAGTGRRLLHSDEEEEGRKAAEAELARLREELKRLKGH